MESCRSPLSLQVEKPAVAELNEKRGFTEKRGSPTGYWVVQRTLGKIGRTRHSQLAQNCAKLCSDSTASSFRSKLPFSSLFKCRLYIWGELQKKHIEY